MKKAQQWMAAASLACMSHVENDFHCRLHQRIATYNGDG